MRSGAWLLLALLCAMGAAACGYRQDVPALPGAARSLALGRIANLTGTGEVDVRLRAVLQRRLEGLAHVQLLSTERGEVLLELELTGLSLSRTLDPAITAARSLSYTLSGRLTLTDQRSGQRLIDGETLSASAGRQFLPGVRETPAVRDTGLNDVLVAFAEQVEQRLFRTF